MAAVAPSSDKAANLIQELSIDSQSKTTEVSEPVKKHTSVDSGNFANGTAPPFEQSTTPPVGFSPEQYGYGYEAQQWEQPYVDHSIYGDNPPVLYSPGYGYHYGMYPPQGSVVTDGPLYQYPNYVTIPGNGGPYNRNLTNTSQVELSTDQASFPSEPIKGNSKNLTNGGGVNVNNNGSKPQKQNYQNSGFALNDTYGGNNGSVGFSSFGYEPRYGFGPQGLWVEPSAYTDVHSKNLPSGRNQPFVPYAGMPLPGGPAGMGFMGLTNPNARLYGQYGNTYRYGSNGYNNQGQGRGYSALKSKGRSNNFYGYGNENTDGLNELNRGPRGKGCKNQKGQSIPLNGVNNEENLPLIPNREQYNKDDFPVDYEDAKFFIIKSYSEDDVHKSIKYNVWASTSNGNSKLDGAYRDAQEKSVRTPIFLLFSVNTSGQFVGLAEMIGQVDFNKSMEYWQQDKWNGWFPLKWHIVKDVPNNLLKHITLENNENKPVTNSRDTQEVSFEQGIQILKIFKGHSSKSCILDDFGFYEARQKTMQEKKAKQQQFHKQVLDLKPTEAAPSENKESLVEKPRTPVPEGVSILTNKERVSANGDLRLLEEKKFETGSAVAIADDPKSETGSAVAIADDSKLEKSTAVTIADDPKSENGSAVVLENGLTVAVADDLKLENGSTGAVADDSCDGSPKGDEESVEKTIVSKDVVGNDC